MSKVSNKQDDQSHRLPGGDLRSLDVWEFIHDKLSANTNVILMYVLESEGSSPGRKGFKMAVAADGDLCGTIGGGIMEHKLAEKARALLRSDIKGVELIKQFHDKIHNKDQSGMICSGSQLNVLIPLHQSKNKETIKKIIDTRNKKQTKTIQLSPSGIEIIDGPFTGLEYKTENEWRYTESTAQQPVIHIIGGGHVGLALSELMHFLGFYIKLYDDRSELNTIEQNSFANEKHFIDYNTIDEKIDSSDKDFAVVMTVGYRTDKIVLKKLLDKKFFYIGLLGSEKKNKKLFEELKAEGAGDDKLNKVFRPVGINIFSKTSKEIAVSIAAQIIFEKNKDLPTGRNK